MSIKLLRIACLALLSTFALHSEAQDWIVYNESNSRLPNNQVQAIAIDKKGVRWIGTADGLASFNGKTWTIYQEGNSPLPSSMIRALVVDNQENVWIGTDKGLAVFDRITWKLYSSQNSIFLNDAITTIHCDRKTGNIWIGTEKGLVKYDAGSWTRFDDSNSSLINDHIYSIAVDKAGIVWVGTFDHFQFAGRLNRYDGTKWELIKLEQKELNSSFPQTMVIDENNILWMGVKGTTGGALVRIDGNEWQILNNQSSKNLVGGIQTLVIDGNDKWIGTGAGLTLYNGATFQNLSSSTSALPDNFIYSIAIDDKGNTWIGTVYGGLAVYKAGGVASDTAIQASVAEFNVFPNPIKSVTNIVYTMAEKAKVAIHIYNSSGRLVEVVHNKIVDKGTHTIKWSPKKLSAGIYFCTINNNNKKYTKKLFIY